ncbi:PIN domain-containing protein [Butyrivibrio sp. XBB1001]|uniref:PIN domain-containing protein n=1 Tax=Butyrivibrio sp. XBB1001 TaxID=1280682 RepID=UPI000426D68B|nr:PIN domain-containing protein [Butyrivibrio sp. XBB1001]
MAAILVDYENVSGMRGLKGVEYLNEGDYLEIFYGNSAGMAAQYMDYIKESGCKFSIHKLKDSRKNALDFYIATEAGRLAEEGQTQIAIITRDKGLCSIKDYFDTNEELVKSRLVISEDIEHGLEQLAISNEDIRANLIRQRLKSVNFEMEYKRMKEQEDIRNRIITALENSEFNSVSEKVVEFYKSSRSKAAGKIHLDALRIFGLKDGETIYRLIKDVV